MLRFLVVGTMRSGTAYAAQVLNRSGIACGHNWVYTEDGVPRYPQFEILGDASTLAAPLVREFPGLVLHQVRDPLRVIGSLVGSAPGGNPLADGPEGAFLAQHFASSGDPLDDAMRYYVEWNTRCERHNGYLRYRVEDLGAALIRRIADLIGQVVDDATIDRALTVVPASFNTRYSARHIGWSDLPAGSSRDALERLARRYGYPVLDSPRLRPIASGC
jgi:hypothetical protein